MPVFIGAGTGLTAHSRRAVQRQQLMREGGLHNLFFDGENEKK